MEPISISGLQGVQKKIADAIDDGNGKLEKDEISVFNKVNEILEDSDNTPKTAIEKLKEFLSNSRFERLIYTSFPRFCFRKFRIGR